MKQSRVILPLVLLGVALAAVVAVVLTLLGVPWWLAVVVAVAGAGGLGWWLWRRTPARLLASFGARPIVPGRQPRLANLVDGLCVSHGMKKPRLFIVDEPTLNAAAVVSSHEHPALVFTKGMLEALDQIQLEAVVAHLLVVADDDNASAATHIVPFLGWAPTRPLVAPALHGFVADQKVLVADLAGVGLTRYPPGLISALEAIGDGGSAVPGAPATTAHLWLAPIRADADAVVPVEKQQPFHPPLELRIATLREL